MRICCKRLDSMFQPDELERLVPRLRGGPRLADVNGQGTAVLDPDRGDRSHRLRLSGQRAASIRGRSSRSRPMTLSQAATARNPTAPNHVGHRINDVVRRMAVSIESFHKASLVHDDIQDGDDFRYGEPTLHIEHGVPTAINVGDYLIGLGLSTRDRDIDEMGADAAADILNKLADAHTKLSEGQGAELVWRDSRDKRLTPQEALNIYASKTAPAFEAALYCGVRLAGPADHYAEPIANLARHLGIAFQILNDLQDWNGDDFNKLTLGGDVLGGRPTVLWALALEGLQDADRRELEQLVAEGNATPAVFAQIRHKFHRAGVFEKALRLVAEHRAQAERVADELSPDALRRLGHHLIETVLEQPAAARSVPPPLGSSRPVTDPHSQSADADLFTPSASRLATLFYTDLAELGRFEPVHVDKLPGDYRALLAHQDHMTVALEAHSQHPRECSCDQRVARRIELRSCERAESPNRRRRRTIRNDADLAGRPAGSGSARDHGQENTARPRAHSTQRAARSRADYALANRTGSRAAKAPATQRRLANIRPFGADPRR